jgi:NCS1 family nucleobase:cation symporter-1
VALVCGVVIALIGLFVPALRWLYDYAWFVGFGMAMVVYLGLMRGVVKAASAPFDQAYLDTEATE